MGSIAGFRNRSPSTYETRTGTGTAGVPASDLYGTGVLGAVVINRNQVMGGLYDCTTFVLAAGVTVTEAPDTPIYIRATQSIVILGAIVADGVTTGVSNNGPGPIGSQAPAQPGGGGGGGDAPPDFGTPGQQNFNNNGNGGGGGFFSNPIIPNPGSPGNNGSPGQNGATPVASIPGTVLPTFAMQLALSDTFGNVFIGGAPGAQGQQGPQGGQGADSNGVQGQGGNGGQGASGGLGGGTIILRSPSITLGPASVLSAQGLPATTPGSAGSPGASGFPPNGGGGGGGPGGGGGQGGCGGPIWLTCETFSDEGVTVRLAGAPGSPGGLGGPGGLGVGVTGANGGAGGNGAPGAAGSGGVYNVRILTSS
jgi:hypothetical protein